MNNKIVKIYNQEDFNRITKGIKVAQCMQSQQPSVLDTEKILTQLEDLVVSDSLSCSFCNTSFEDKAQQRLHYKLDWHRYNLKQRLNGLKSISEDGFSLLADTGDVSSLSGSDIESENEDETGTSETGGSPSCHSKSNEGKSKNNYAPNKIKKQEKRGKSLDSDSSDTECNEEIIKSKKIQALLAVASRHSKVFFENDDGNIFSIYRCLLHSKKEIPEVDNEMIAQALDSGKKTTWTVIMVGGGHFAAAVFQDGEPVVHKTFHSYTVRAKQGGAQSTRDNRTSGSYPKSAGASLRRFNEMAFTQHVQEILESWSVLINNSSLILYRAVGPHNRSVLFGGKNSPLDKSDSRLRPLPFPTRRATFSEVKRVYDILTTMEIYGSASDFTDSFPISPRQPLRKKTSKLDVIENSGTESVIDIDGRETCEDNEKFRPNVQSSPERQHKSIKMHIDRAKPRKSPSRPLPEIVARLAQSSSESEFDSRNSLNIEDTAPRYMKNKKTRRQKRKVKRQSIGDPEIEIILNAKVKLWDACKLGDNDLLSSVINELKDEVKKCEEAEEEVNKGDGDVVTSNLVSMNSIIKLVNDSNEEGNTMLHLAAEGGHLKLVWLLLEAGSNPCNKNKKSQTPYVAATDKETRNIFRKFMGINPDKFNYSKSQIPGPITEELEQKYLEKKKQLKKHKREKDKIRKKEFETKKQEEEAKQRFLNLSDREKRAMAAEQRILKQGGNLMSRCFQCAVDMTGQVPFEYNANRFCSMPCLKEHRLRNKFIA
ncbi:tRNA endonuclease ANKZF1-like isoform X2 [Prorops nasuta]|uniref:tRNA endonuclease ANKZF1-like isoform X2 n=1 Tax=Prorops nasuta TaxID=863751 RepID=UPI0034CE82E9